MLTSYMAVFWPLSRCDFTTKDLYLYLYLLYTFFLKLSSYD